MVMINKPKLSKPLQKAEISEKKFSTCCLNSPGPNTKTIC